MNTILLTALGVLLPAQAPASVLELKLVMDKTVIARGDLAYCEVQLWNHNSTAIEVPKIVSDNLLHIEVEVSDGKFITTQSAEATWGIEGISPKQSIEPGKYISCADEIRLWNRDVLKKISELQKEIVGTATLWGDYRKYVTPVRFSFTCCGRIASEEFLVDTLYQTEESRARALELAETFHQFYETVDCVRVDHLLSNSLITGKAVDKLLKNLRPGTSVWRKAMVARLTIEYAKAPNMPFEKFERRLMPIVTKGGLAEQRCLLLRTATGLRHRGRQEGTRVEKELMKKLPNAVARTREDARRREKTLVADLIPNATAGVSPGEFARWTQIETSWQQTLFPGSVRQTH